MCLGPRQERRRQKAPSESEEQQKRDLKICSLDPSTNSHNHDGLSRLRRCLSVFRSNFLSFYLFLSRRRLASSKRILSVFFSRTFPNIQSVNRRFQCLIIFKLFSLSDFFFLLLLVRARWYRLSDTVPTTEVVYVELSLVCRCRWVERISNFYLFVVWLASWRRRWRWRRAERRQHENQNVIDFNRDKLIDFHPFVTYTTHIHMMMIFD